VSPAKTTAELIEMLGGPNEPLLDGCPDPPSQGAICNVSLLKSIVSHCCGVRSKKSLAASARLLQPTALSTTGQWYINFHREKISGSLLCGLSSKVVDHLFNFCTHLTT